MCPVLPSPSHSSDAAFALLISRKFAHGRFLIVGANSQELERQFAEAKRDAVVMWAPNDLLMRLGHGEALARFEAAVWFYSSGDNDDQRMAETLSRCVANIVLAPGPALTLPRAVRNSFTFSSALDYSLITTAT